MKWIVALLFFVSPAMADDEYKMPQIPTEEEKIEALKLGYILNGMSMVRAPGLGSIDLSGPAAPPVVAAESIKPKGKAK